MKKVLDFLIKFIYINIVNRTVFFYLVLIFIEAVYSENCSNAVLLTQKILPFCFKESQVEKLCECGCGELVKHPERGCRFLVGHNQKGIKQSLQTILKKSKSLKKVIHTEEWNRKVGIALKGKKFSKERCKNISEGHKGIFSTEEGKEKQSKTMKKRYISGEIIIWNKNKKLSEEQKKNRRKKLGKKNSGENHPMYKKHHTEESIEKMHESHQNMSNKDKREMKRKMRTKAFERMLKGEGKIKIRTGKLEIFFEENVLQQIDGLIYVAQEYIKEVGFVDFFLSEYNIIIECDEGYHLRNKQRQKDVDRDFAAGFWYKYKTIRFEENEIKESSIKCIRKLKKFIKRKC